MQLTCTLAIFACLFAADAAACNLSTGTAPFAVAAVPSAEAGDALRAPALEMVSLTRGINGRASCDASGLLTMSVEWPRGTDYKLRELGFEFRVVGGEDRLSIFPKNMRTVHPNQFSLFDHIPPVTTTRPGISRGQGLNNLHRFRQMPNGADQNRKTR